MMTIIAPSLLSADFLNLESELEYFDGLSDLWFHLDIMDGHFVPNLTFGHPIIKQISQKAKHPLDAHLMVTNPEFYVETLKDFNIHNFTFHWEACTHHDRLINEAKKHFKSVGVSLNPSTPLNVIPDYLYKELDLILLMSVNPGFGGQSFISGVLEKVKRLKAKKEELGASFHIQVDGGVNENTSKDLRKHGATNLVAGSFIFKANADQYKKKVDELR